MRVGTAKVVDVQCGFDYAPSSALNAQMSLRYTIALALLEGQVRRELAAAAAEDKHDLEVRGYTMPAFAD